MRASFLLIIFVLIVPATALLNVQTQTNPQSKLVYRNSGLNKITIIIYGDYNNLSKLASLISLVDMFGGADRPYPTIILPNYTNIAITSLLKDIKSSYDDIEVYILSGTMVDSSYYKKFLGVAPKEVDLSDLGSHLVRRSSKTAVIVPNYQLSFKKTLLLTTDVTVDGTPKSHTVSFQSYDWFYMETGKGWIYYKNMSLNDTGDYYGIKIYSPNVVPFALYSNFTGCVDSDGTVAAKHYEELGDLDPPTLTLWPINYYGLWAIFKTYDSGDLQVISVPGKEVSFDVPAGLYILNISTYNVSGGTYNIFVLDSKNFVRGYIRENSSSSANIEIPYPESGKWKIIVLSQNPSVSLSVKIELDYLPNLLDFESYLNGLVLAQRLSAQIFIYDGNIPNLSGINNVYIVDFNNSIPASIDSHFSSQGISVKRINSFSKLIQELVSLKMYPSNQLILLDEYSNIWFPALIEGFYHGAPIQLINQSIMGSVVWAQRIWNWVVLMADNYHNHLELAPLPVYDSHFGKIYFWGYQRVMDLWMSEIYGTIRQGIPYITQYNASLIIVANRYTVPMFLDRALEGEIIVGRIYRNRLNFNKQSPQAVAMAYRAFLHRALIRGNPAYANRKVLSTIVVYSWNWSYEYWPIDNFGNNFVGYTEPDDINNTIKTTKFSGVYHTEFQEVNQTLNSGTLLWYYSGHGLGGSGFGLFTPDAPRAWESGGNLSSPDIDGDGWVNPPYNQYVSASEVNDSLSNLHSMFMLSLGCVSGAWEVPDVMLQHGSSGFVVSVTLHWGVIGEKLFVTVMDKVLGNHTYGEALQYALIMYSRIWSNPKPYVNESGWQGKYQDDNAPVILYGDPNIKLLGYQDTDKDGIVDSLEVALHTNPTNPDSDGDGLNDTAELFIYHTNPTNPDSDGDGYNDGVEISSGTDPLDPNSHPQGTPTQTSPGGLSQNTIFIVLVILVVAVVSISILILLRRRS